MTKRVLVFAVSFVLVGLTCVPFSAQAEDKKVYNKYNIHTQMKGPKVSKASYANYTNPGAGHLIISPNTLLTIADTDSDLIEFELEDGREILFEFHEPRMGMTVDKYIELITSPEPVSLDKFSDLDKKGIKEGKAIVGMTKDGVLTSLGYPASHKTPSLESGSWVYWTNRFGTIRVDFDDDGKVAKIVD